LSMFPEMKFSLDQMVIDKIMKDGKVISGSDYYDVSTIIRQLGLDSKDELAFSESD